MLFHHVRHHLQGRCHLQWTEGFVTSMLFHNIIFREDVTFSGLKIRAQACFFITLSSGKMSPSVDWKFSQKHAFSLHYLKGRCHLQWTEDFVTSMLFHYIIFRADVTFSGLKIQSQACFFITSDIIFRADVTFNGLKMIRSQACFFITSDISREKEWTASINTNTYFLLSCHTHKSGSFSWRECSVFPKSW